eukprot:TRINITY_DN990_c0_g2_i2.p3 TRINITY_DN990_c0_g2~~TRINITY_DN990_c0_g2_i2.p3  ORF type:complete len:144 (-),score=42.08 TRINITY_DN990_c0_g2_i2:154-585(-)
MLVAEYADLEKTPEKPQQTKELNYEELKTASPPVPEEQIRLMRNSIEDYISPEERPSPRDNDERIYICANEDDDFAAQTDRKINTGYKLRSPATERSSRRQASLLSKQSARDSMRRPKPVFDNYTRKTSNYFDPYLQFGGATM